MFTQLILGSLISRAWEPQCRLEMGLLVDRLKPGSCTMIDENIKRRLFKNVSLKSLHFETSL
jgi:hypothetical protein